MPGSINSEYCGSCHGNYSTLCAYSGARYAPLCSSGRVIQPTFDAVGVYTTGYCGSGATKGCCGNVGASYNTLGCTYVDCSCKPCKVNCAPVCIPQRAVVNAALANNCNSCGNMPIIKGCNGYC